MKAEDLKNSISPLSFYERELSINTRRSRDGWVDGGLCPFHNDAHTGNFRVNIETGAFKCFACNKSGGDIISFGLAAWGRSFVETLKILEREYK